MRVWTYVPAGLTADARILFVLHGSARNATAYMRPWAHWAERHTLFVVVPEFSRELYPYLAWAEAHFHGRPPPMDLSGGAPLTWEARASEADYGRMAAVLPGHAEARISLPHTWHAAEMFLYLIEGPESEQRN